MRYSDWRNESGEALLTATEMRFEAALEEQAAAEAWEERWLDDHDAMSRSGCGTTGCEYHDGECADNWGRDESDTGPLSEWSREQYWTP